jgi:hypothetical protein
MNFLKSTFLICAIIIAISANLSAQEVYFQEKGKFGLMGSMQNSTPEIGVVHWFNPRIVIAPSFSLEYQQRAGTDIGAYLAARYVIVASKLSPYVTGRLGTLFYESPSDDKADNAIDILAGVGFGAEYFFAREFSIGVEATGNILETEDGSDRIAVPGGTAYFTSTVVRATVYF